MYEQKKPIQIDILVDGIFAFVCIYTFLLRCQHTTSVLQMRPWLFIWACYQTRLHTHMSTVIIERVCECL